MIKILIVDDTKSVHSFVKNILSKSNEISTKSVYDGMEATEYLKLDPKIDLILLDWEMPKLNGLGTLTKLKSMSLQIPVIMMTTKTNPEDISKALELGASEYLMKPFVTDILFEKISTVLNLEISYVA